MGLHLSGTSTAGFVGGNVLGLGVKGDVKTVTDAAITSGQATLSSTSAAFTAADVGKVVQVVGAGAAYPNKGTFAGSTVYAFHDRVVYSGNTYVCVIAHTSTSTFDAAKWAIMPGNADTLMTTIASVSGGVATLAATASSTVSGATCVYGTDDSAVLTALPAGDYYLPGERTYFLVNWFLPSKTTLTIGPGAVFKMPGFGGLTDPAVFRLMTSNRTSTSLVTDVRIKGVARFDGTELTPPSGTVCMAVHVLNATDYFIEAVHGIGIPGNTGNVIQSGANQAGTTNARGKVGWGRNQNVRGLGSSCVQHTGGSQVEYGPLVCDGGVAARIEMDGNATLTDNVKVQLAHASGGTGAGAVFTNTAVYLLGHNHTLRNVEVGAVLAENGADGSRWDYDAGGSVTGSVIRRMRVTGGGRGALTTSNDLVMPGCAIYDAHVDGAAAQALRGTNQTVGFTVVPGMTLVNCRATNGGGEGFLDLFTTSGTPATGTRATLVNCEATGNAAHGMRFRYTEKVTVVGGEVSTNGTYGLRVDTGVTLTHLNLSNHDNTTGTVNPSGTGTVSTPATPGAWQDMTLTAAVTQAAGYDNAGARLEGDVVRLRGQVIAAAGYTGGQVIFTLPSGLRPTNPKRIGARTLTGANTLFVTASGDVSYTAAITSTNWAALDGIIFSL